MLVVLMGHSKVRRYVERFGYKILVKIWVLGVGCWVLDVGCWMLGVGCNGIE